ncbi:MAG TPA: class I SAM-dependent methyltransferase [Blastocatellia bacterium]|nr:class I SAM-dependent methyltransferase [Blastocatellia bacterium]
MERVRFVSYPFSMNAQAQTDLLRADCDICGSTGARELYRAKDRLGNSDEYFTIAECAGCGVLRTLPVMDERELARYYPSEYWGEASEPSEDWIRRSQAEKIDFLSRCYPEGGRILDVGCGSGFFLRALDCRRWEPFGIEISEAAARAANRALGQGRVFKGTLIESACEDSYFDVLTFWSSLEHTNEPRSNLVEARRIIKRGGTLIVQVPNAASYQARAFCGDWFALDAPRHRYHFTPQVLARLLREARFEIYQTTFFSRTHNSHALRQSLKQRLVGDPPSAAGKTLFLLTIPFIKPFDWLMSAQGKGATVTVAARAI